MGPYNTGLVVALGLFCILTFPSVQSQSIEQQVRANLTKVVRFVVGPSAEPNQDLINLAFASGGSPKTQKDRIRYLNIMKAIARNTPSVAKRFTTSVTRADGTKLESIDGTAIDAHITMRALQYIQKQIDEELAGTKSTAPLSTTSAPIPTTTTTKAPVTKAPQPYPTGFGSGTVVGPGTGTMVSPPITDTNARNAYHMYLARQLEAYRNMAMQRVRNTQITPKSDGTVSLLDLFKLGRAANSMDQMNANADQMPFF